MRDHGVQFVSLQGHLVQLCSADLAAVEHEENFVAFRLRWSPVNNEQPPHLGVEAKIFIDLASARLRPSLARLDVTARDVPALFVVWLDEKNAPVLIEDQRPGRNTGRDIGGASGSTVPRLDGGLVTRHGDAEKARRVGSSAWFGR